VVQEIQQRLDSQDMILDLGSFRLIERLDGEKRGPRELSSRTPVGRDNDDVVENWWQIQYSCSIRLNSED
jgi:hypothetical protein